MLFSILNNTRNCLVTKVQVQVQDLNCQNYNQCLKCLGLSLLFLLSWSFSLGNPLKVDAVPGQWTGQTQNLNDMREINLTEIMF